MTLTLTTGVLQHCMLELRVGNWKCIEYSVLVWLAVVSALASVPCAMLCLPAFFECSECNLLVSSDLLRGPPTTVGGGCCPMLCMRCRSGAFSVLLLIHAG